MLYVTQEESMESFPHRYRVKGRALSDTDVSLVTEGAPEISSVPPVQFGDSGEKWSPESLLVAAVSDYFILTFKAIASSIIKISFSQFEYDRAKQ